MNPKIRFAAAAALALVILAALIISPAGSVLADEVQHFFDRIQGNSIPLAPDEIFTPMPSATPAPTHALPLVPAEGITQATPTATPAPAASLQEGDLQDMSLMEAEAAVGFDLYEPLKLPRDYRLTRITYDPQRQAASLWYASPQAGSGEFILLTQGRHLEPLSVGADAQVETAAVGPYSAEFVRGTWFTANGASQKTWVNDAEVYTLRWQAEDVVFSMQFMLNEPISPAFLERDEMLAAAQALARCPSGGDQSCPIQQAAAAAGFTPWQFSAVPPGFSFLRVDYRPGLTSLWYGKGAEQLHLLQSTQGFGGEEAGPWNSASADEIQTVMVAGQPAEYVRGQYLAAAGETQAAWDAQAPIARLRWQNGAWWFQIVRTGQRLPQAQELASLAGSLAAVPAQPPTGSQPTPDASASQMAEAGNLAEVQAKVSFPILKPGVLPEGLAFSHARYEPFSGAVMLFYGSFAPDRLRANGPVLMVSEAPGVRISHVDGEFPPEAIQQVTVNGFPGQLVAGMLTTGPHDPGTPAPTPVWDASSGVYILVWSTDSMSFAVQFNPAGREVRLTPQEMIQIAESLK